MAIARTEAMPASAYLHAQGIQVLRVSSSHNTGGWVGVSQNERAVAYIWVYFARCLSEAPNHPNSITTAFGAGGLCLCSVQEERLHPGLLSIPAALHLIPRSGAKVRERRSAVDRHESGATTVARSLGQLGSCDTVYATMRHLSYPENEMRHPPPHRLQPCLFRCNQWGGSVQHQQLHHRLQQIGTCCSPGA